MSLFDKFRIGAQKAGTQASTFVQRSSRDVATGAHGFAHSFSLPGESEKAANILASFLGTCLPQVRRLSLTLLLKRTPRTLSQRSTRSPKLSYNKREASTDSDWSDSHSFSCRPRHLPSDQSGLCLLRQSRLGNRHCPPPGWLMVGSLLHRNRWSRLGPSNRCRYHRLCHRPQQRRCRPCFLHGRQCHNWGKHQRRGGSHRHRRQRPSVAGSSGPHVLLFQIKG